MINVGNSKKGEIEIIKPNLVFSNQYIQIYNDNVKFPAGNLGTYIRISNSSDKSVAIFPVTTDGNIVVIRNFRHGVRGWGIEIPKGAIEPDETSQEAALRELEEETGYTCQKLVHICEYSESPAIFSNKIDCYLALNCRLIHEPHSENTEAIDKSFEISLKDFLERKYDADFIDALSELLAYQYYFIKEEIQL